MENVNIHKTAVIHPGAKLSSGVNVGPYSVIEGSISLGDNVRIGSHCVITVKSILALSWGALPRTKSILPMTMFF